MPRTTGIRLSSVSPRSMRVRPIKLAVRKPSSVSAVKATIRPKPGMGYGR